jgi:hypothetical protein
MIRQWFVYALSAVFLLSGIVGCSPMDKGQQKSGKTIQHVQEEHTREWMAIPGVEGTAIGLYNGKPCIKIFSSVKPQKLHGKIPSSVEGYSVIIEETGTFRALNRQ